MIVNEKTLNIPLTPSKSSVPTTNKEQPTPYVSDRKTTTPTTQKNEKQDDRSELMKALKQLDSI